MTLILGMVCTDGVVLASDSKSNPKDGGKPSYNNQKIYDLGYGIGMAVGGVVYEELGEAMAVLMGYFLKANPNATAGEVSKEVKEQAKKLITSPDVVPFFVVADSKSLYLIEFPDGTVRSDDSVIAGIKDFKLLPQIKQETTKAYSRHFKRTLKLNVGRAVGGLSQVLILESKKE